MKKTLLALILTITSVYGADYTVQVDQNIKALYKDTFAKLSHTQQKFIRDNRESMRRTIQASFDEQMRSFSIDLIIKESDVIEFTLHPDNSITDFNYLIESENRKMDTHVRLTIIELAHKYPTPDEATPIRYIETFTPTEKRP